MLADFEFSCWRTGQRNDFDFIMITLQWILVIFVISGRLSSGEVTEPEYALMPELFYLDNFDQCLLLEDRALFCTFTFTLKPLGNTTNNVWNIIKSLSSNPQNYRHDKLRHGICVPHTCAHYYSQNSTVKDSIKKCYNEKFREKGLKGSVSTLHCQTNRSDYLIDAYDIAYAAIMSIYILFVLIASCYERYSSNDDQMTFYKKNVTTGVKFIAAFSIPKNWHRLRSTNDNADHRKLKSIQGIRFYNMICVIMSHTVMAILGGPVSNPRYTENSTKLVLNMFIANGWYAVQTFFLISGWLLSYHFFDMADGDSKKVKLIHVLFAVVNRYVRLVPVLAVIIGFESTWFVHISKGPYWDFFVGEEYRNCRANWWTNILFVNNYVASDNMCLHQTWYIAADMQLFLFSIVVLYIITKFPTKLKHIFGFVLVIGFILPGVLAYVFKYDIIVRQYPEAVYKLNLLKLEVWKALYSSGHSNLFGFTTGIIFGYLFYKYRRTTLTIRMVHKVLWWFLTFGMCIFVVLIAAMFYDPDFEVTPLKSALYWACGKNLFALGIGIGIFGFTQKIGWFARWVSEWQPVQVLGRLTYSTYIVHTLFIRGKAGYRRYPSSANDSMIFSSVLGDVAISYLGGTVLCLLVEMPVSALQKMLGTGVRKQNRSSMVKKSSEKSLETLDLENGHNIS